MIYLSSRHFFFVNKNFLTIHNYFTSLHQNRLINFFCLRVNFVYLSIRLKIFSSFSQQYAIWRRQFVIISSIEIQFSSFEQFTNFDKSIINTLDFCRQNCYKSLQLSSLLTFVFLNRSSIVSLFSSLETSNRRSLIYLFFRSIESLTNLFFVKFTIDFTKLQKSIDNYKFIKILFQNQLFHRFLTTIRRQATSSFQIDFTFVYRVFLTTRQSSIHLSLRRLFRKTCSISMLRLTILSTFYLTIIHAIFSLYLIDKKRVLRNNNETFYKFWLIRCKRFQNLKTNQIKKILSNSSISISFSTRRHENRKN